MIQHSQVGQRATVRRALYLALAIALCVAALTAVGAILSGDFDETDARVIATSLGFAVFSATAASGASLRFRDSKELRALGLATIAVSAVSFSLWLVAIWSDGDENAWRWFGSMALATFACSHASIVSGALRGTDAPMVQLVAMASIALGVVDSTFGILAVSGAVDEVAEGLAKLMAVLVILLLLTTVLPPILRRLQRPAVEAPLSGAGAPPAAHAIAASAPVSTPLRLAEEVLAAADRIETLNADPGNRAPEIRRDASASANSPVPTPAEPIDGRFAEPSLRSQATGCPSL